MLLVYLAIVTITIGYVVDTGYNHIYLFLFLFEMFMEFKLQYAYW